MSQIPLLIISDAPDQPSGLGRIARDLATVFVSMPEVRVATLGLGMRGSVKFPWTQYAMTRWPAGDYEYGELSLPYVWEDWSRGQQGIVLTIQDLSRMLWLARPEHVADDALREWLIAHRSPDPTRDGGFRLWGYFPIDSTGPGGQLTTMSREVLLGYDRILAYSPWALSIMEYTLGGDEAARRGATWLPHGLGMEVFRP